jgi:hypothetical protein
MFFRLLLLAGFAIHLLPAQESRATIVGRVVDPSGAVVIGAKVHATNTAQNTRVSTQVNDQGYYEISYLLPGVYRVEVELTGFKKSVRDGIELRVNDRMPLDFTLAVGDLAESVVVTGETPLLESQTASIGMIMDERRVSALPIVGGNPFYLVRLSPGVISIDGRYAGNPIDQGAATGVIVNGTRSNSSEHQDRDEYPARHRVPLRLALAGRALAHQQVHLRPHHGHRLRGQEEADDRGLAAPALGQEPQWSGPSAQDL